MSDFKKDKLNILLRRCVRDLIPEVDELQSRGISMHRLSQQLSHKNADSVIPDVEEEIQLLMRSDPGLVEGIVSKLSDDILSKLKNKQQQIEKLLDNVVTRCRPMSRGEKKDLQKSIKELPAKNLERVAKIIKDRYAALGKQVTDDEFLINLEEQDNMTLWRLHIYIGAVKNAQKLANAK